MSCSLAPEPLFARENFDATAQLTQTSFGQRQSTAHSGPEHLGFLSVGFAVAFRVFRGDRYLDLA